MKTVLITGATSGIGYALAKVFASRQFQIILVSSNSENLKATQTNLENKFGVPIKRFQQDLSQLGAAKALYDKLQAEKIEIDILVNNAGYGLVGTTEQIDFDKDQKMMILNMITPVSLCKLFLPHMYKRKSGAILNIASTGAFQPGPFTSTYFASKAFVLSYSLAIRFEAKKHGISVCALCPGATKTNFFAKENTSVPRKAMPAEQVAQYAYRQLMKNKPYFIPGFLNRIMQRFPSTIKMRHVARIKQTKTK